MKEITILSGKGGTGKTSVSAAFASIAGNSVICDCDVDASDLFILLDPVLKEKHSFESGAKVCIDQEKCSGCALCYEHCRFEAISKEENNTYVINETLCEGCLLCEKLCPEKAVISQETFDNQWFVSETLYGPFVHARMEPGQENSGKLVTQLRRKAKEIASEKELEFIISDGPPGIGCPVIAAITGSKHIMLVIEPTKSGLHDADRLIDLASSFQIPISAIINKYDIFPAMTMKIEEYLAQKNVEYLGRIPFDPLMLEALAVRKNIVEYAENAPTSMILKDIWLKIKLRIADEKQERK
jgi:MinD superfamily P-loop ATPase